MGYRAAIVSGVALALLSAPAAAEKPIRLSFAGGFEAAAPATPAASTGRKLAPRKPAAGAPLLSGLRLEAQFRLQNDPDRRWDFALPGARLFEPDEVRGALGREIVPQWRVSFGSGGADAAPELSPPVVAGDKPADLVRRFGANLAYQLTAKLDLCVNYRYRALDSDKAQIAVLTTSGAALTDVAPVLSAKNFEEQALLFGVRWRAF